MPVFQVPPTLLRKEGKEVQKMRKLAAKRGYRVCGSSTCSRGDYQDDSKSSIPDLLPARFALNKEDSPKKRVFKHGSAEIPNNHGRAGFLS
jgi:hypothetical protein